MKLEDKMIHKILFLTLIANVIYILLLDTSTLHGLDLPSINIWSIILLIPILITSYNVIIPSKRYIDYILYFSLILSLFLGILRIFDYTYQSQIYPYLILICSIALLVALILEKKYILAFYTSSLFFTTIIAVLNLLSLNTLNSIIGPILELSIVVAIIAFYRQSKISPIEIAIVSIMAIIGFMVGSLISTFDVAPLILKTVIEQLLGVSQYSISTLFTSDNFFALHFAEIFSVAVYLVIKRKSLLIFSIIISGFDLSFAPMISIRILVILLFLREMKNKEDLLSKSDLNYLK